MGHVTVSVNGRKYRMSCEDGAEQRVVDLATYVEGVVQEIKGGFRQVQEERLYLMAAIMIADQLTDVRAELQRTLAQICNLRSFQAADSTASYIPSRDVARIVDASSARLQALEQRFAITGTEG
jgi:cell division protein ZapA